MTHASARSNRLFPRLRARPDGLFLKFPSIIRLSKDRIRLSRDRLMFSSAAGLIYGRLGKSNRRAGGCAEYHMAGGHAGLSPSSETRMQVTRIVRKAGTPSA